jgi:hypothetical protein
MSLLRFYALCFMRDIARVLDLCDFIIAFVFLILRVIVATIITSDYSE